MELTTHEVCEGLSKGELVALVKLYGRLGLTLGSLWFLEMEKATDPERATKSDAEVWRRQGELEAKYLKLFLGKETVTALRDVGKAFFEGFLKGLNPALRFRCVTCPPDACAEDLWCSWEAWYENS